MAESVHPVRRAEIAFKLLGRAEEFVQYYEQNRFGDVQIGGGKDDKDGKNEAVNEDDIDEDDERKMLIVDVKMNEDGTASIAKPSDRSVASGSRASQPRRRRTKQVSLPLHDAFFRKKREKQTSVDRSIESFMMANGLRMPDIPDEIGELDETNNSTPRGGADGDLKDTDSDLSC